MPKKIPTPEGVVLRSFRFAKGLTAEELAQVLDVTEHTVNRWENGGTPLPRQRLDEILGKIGVPPEAIAEALFAHRIGNPPQEPGSFLHPSGEAGRLIHQAAAAAGTAAAETVRARLIQEWRQRLAQDHRRWAKEQWAEIKKLTPARQEVVIRALLDEKNWALAERICQASIEAAAHKADEALRLSRLAVHIAGQLPGPEIRRLHILGYCTDFNANALRVAGDHRFAEEEFLRADDYWKRAETSDLIDLLDRNRRLDLKASLFMFRERTEEAVALLEKALDTAENETTRVRILIKKATALGIAGKFEASLESLESTKQSAERTNSRLLLSHRFETAVQLCNLERFGQAEPLLAQLHLLAEDHELACVRVRWLEGRIWLGLGRREQALAALSEAHLYFKSRQIDYDFALVSLELAVTHLEQERKGRVQKLAGEMLWIFQRQQIHKEALAALAVFCHAARAQQIQLEGTKRLLRYLYRAQHAPSLRFDYEVG